MLAPHQRTLDMRLWCRTFSTVARRCAQDVATVAHWTDVPNRMSAWQCLNFVKPHNVDIDKELHCTRTRRLPTITRPDHLLIKVHAASLNPVDVLSLYGYGASFFACTRWFGSTFGLMGLPHSEETTLSGSPFTPGRDFAGRVVGLCPLVSTRQKRLHIHQRVAGATWPFLSTTGSGALSEYLVCPVAYLSVVPENVGSIEAAAVGYAGLTAWSALSAGGLSPNSGDTVASAPLVLVIGASGGVGLIAAQLAKLWGARVHVTCPDDVKAQQHMKELAFDDVIVHPDTPPLGTRYDIIVNCVRPKTFPNPASAESVDVLQSVARLAAPGVPALFDFLHSDCRSRYVSLNPPVLPLMDQCGVLPGAGMAFAQLIGTQLLAWIPTYGTTHWGQLRWAFFQPSSTRLDQLLQLVSTGALRLYIDSVYPFNQVPEAFKRLQSKRVRSKVVVLISE